MRRRHTFFWRHRRTILALLVVFFYTITVAYAVPPSTKYQPGETLDPGCAPGDTNCSVEIIPDQTGNSGKYLTTDGSSLSWGAVSAYTASNGLTMTSNDVELGGTLTQDTTIDTSGNQLNVTGTNASGTLTVANTGSASYPALVIPSSSGYVGIGTSSPAGLLHVEKAITNVSGTGTPTNWLAYFHDSLNLNGAGLSGNAGIVATVNSLELTLSADQVINNGTDTAAMLNTLTINNSSPHTLTIDQASSIRTLSVTKSWVYMPTFNAGSTIDYLSNFNVGSISTSSSGTVTNYYGLLISNQTEQAPSINITNRWGIYQEGASDNNYFAANIIADKLKSGGTPPATTGATDIVIADANGLLSFSSAVTNSMLAGSITASKLVGTDIATVGTITSGTWHGTKINADYGGTGLTSLTPYAILAGGTTATGNLQQVSGLGSSGQVLTSSGASALPTWQDVNNIYNSDGTLSGDRTVALGNSALAFTQTNGSGTTTALSIEKTGTFNSGTLVNLSSNDGLYAPVSLTLTSDLFGSINSFELSATNATTADITGDGIGGVLTLTGGNSVYLNSGTSSVQVGANGGDAVYLSGNNGSTQFNVDGTNDNIIWSTGGTASSSGNFAGSSDGATAFTSIGSTAGSNSIQFQMWAISSGVGSYTTLFANYIQNYGNFLITPRTSSASYPSSLLDVAAANGTTHFLTVDGTTGAVALSTLAGSGSGCVAADNSGVVSWTACGGASNTIYTADDSLAGDRNVDLDGNTLSFSDATDGNMLYFAPGGYYTFVGSSDGTASSELDLTSDLSGTNVQFYLGSYDGTNSIGITGDAIAQNVTISAGVDGDILTLTDSDGSCAHNPEAGSETVSCSSDARLKTNIIDTGSALDYFSDFHIRDYTIIASGQETTGVIAQELMQTHPELVSQDANGYYSVQLPNQWKVIKAIQELDLKIADIQTLTDSGDDSFVANLRAWFANAANHITRIFTGEICLTDPDGSSECLNKDELTQLKGLLQTEHQNDQPQQQTDDSSASDTPTTDTPTTDTSTSVDDTSGADTPSTSTDTTTDTANTSDASDTIDSTAQTQPTETSSDTTQDANSDTSTTTDTTSNDDTVPPTIDQSTNQ
ncbi:MAG TPA: tail fiber domain-containing protein [Candidatus Paceibacterota bacterium]|nr:tail fiber domain-containing protein [Candidatus Paceibacterota bacterium]